MITDIGFYAVAIPAVILLGLGKGGFAGIGALSLPLLALSVPPLRGAAIMLPILMVQDIVSVTSYWRQWDWKNLAVLFPGAVVGVFVASLVAAHISVGVFELVLGVISAAFGVRSLLPRLSLADPSPSRAHGVFWGAVSGFTSMVANTGGPPFQIYMTPQRLPHTVFVGTMAFFFFVLNWIKLPPFLALGELTRGTFETSAVLFPLAIASTSR